MKKLTGMTLGRFVGLILVTLVAGAVMLATATRSSAPNRPHDNSTGDGTGADVSAPVVVRDLQPEWVEVLDIYSGMVHPFERYSVGFEVPGRVEQLGRNANGQDLDEGDAVTQGQVLARLDQRLHQARVQEMTALLERAQQELDRARQLRDGPSRAISETVFQQRVTELAVARAQSDQAHKNLEDTTLLAPCDGVISRRLVNSGESIAMHQPAMEIVQVDRVLLILGVPESRVQELENRRRFLASEEATRSSPEGPVNSETQPFKVHVQLMGTDRFGHSWPALDGHVYRISETADDKTGLFEVEVLLDNRDGRLKPGLIALGKIVIDELTAFRLPVHSVLFRGETPYLYAVKEDSSDLKVLFWDLGKATDHRVFQVPLPRYIEQEGNLVVPDLDPAHRCVVVRGHHRLVDGRRVRIVQREPTTGLQTQTAPVRRDSGGPAEEDPLMRDQETNAPRVQHGGFES